MESDLCLFNFWHFCVVFSAVLLELDPATEVKRQASRSRKHNFKKLPILTRDVVSLLIYVFFYSFFNFQEKPRIWPFFVLFLYAPCQSLGHLD